ncbi:MAG: hypothetical protein ACE5FT_06745 [Candidatus Nanoarchaeia archaeon]
MSWLDKLKALFNIEINSPLFSFNFVYKSNNNDSNKEFVYHPDQRKVDVLLDNISAEKKKELAPIIQEYLEAGNRLLESSTSTLLNRLYLYKQQGNDGQILTFFKTLIPEDDYLALEASLFLRHIFMTSGNVKKLKGDIRNRFGDRGNNIANLCTAGYFEEFLMPLYNSAKKEFDSLY